MKRKIVVVIGLASLFGLGYLSLFGIRATNVNSLKKLVSKNVQTGATPEDVIRFLSSRHLDPSQLFRPETMSMNGHHYGGQNIVVGVKRYSARALLWKEAIYLVFVFDENRKLLNYDVFPVYNSL